MERRLICADNSIWVRVLVEIDQVLAAEAYEWFEVGAIVLAPNLLHYEFSHVLTRYVRNRVVIPTDGADLLNALLSLDIQLVDDDKLHRRALSFSMGNPGLSGYDAQYLAVSERTGAELWTADKSLAAVSQRLGVQTRLWVTAPA